MLQKLTAHPKLAGLMVGAGVLSASAAPALAVGQDYSGVTDGITENLATALTASLPAAGAILGVFVGFRVVKRILR